MTEFSHTEALDFLNNLWDKYKYMKDRNLALVEIADEINNLPISQKEEVFKALKCWFDGDDKLKRKHAFYQTFTFQLTEYMPYVEDMISKINNKELNYPGVELELDYCTKLLNVLKEAGKHNLRGVYMYGE